MCPRTLLLSWRETCLDDNNLPLFPSVSAALRCNNFQGYHLSCCSILAGRRPDSLAEDVVMPGSHKGSCRALIRLEQYEDVKTVRVPRFQESYRVSKPCMIALRHDSGLNSDPSANQISLNPNTRYYRRRPITQILTKWSRGHAYVNLYDIQWTRVAIL